MPVRIKTPTQFRREALQRAGIVPPGGHQYTLMDSCTLSGATLDPELRRRGGGYLGQDSFVPGNPPCVHPVHSMSFGSPSRERMVPLEKNFTEEERAAAAEWRWRVEEGH